MAGETAMMGVVEYYRYDLKSAFGHPSVPMIGMRAKLLGAGEVATWLQNDVQYDQSMVSWWIKNVNDVNSGKSGDGPVGSGNAWHTHAASRLLYMYCHWDEEHQVALTCTQAVDALIEYRAVLKSDWKNPDFKGGTFKISYEADGDDALKLFRAHGGLFPSERRK